MATHFSILAWQVPWTGEPGRLQSKGLQRVAHDWTTKPEQKDKHVFAFICMKWPLVTQIINRLKYPAFYIVFPLRYSMDIWNLTFLKKNSQFYAQTLLHSISAKIFTIYFIAQAWYLEVLLDSPISFTPQTEHIMSFYYPCLQNMCQVTVHLDIFTSETLSCKRSIFLQNIWKTAKEVFLL